VATEALTITIKGRDEASDALNSVTRSFDIFAATIVALYVSRAMHGVWELIGKIGDAAWDAAGGFQAMGMSAQTLLAAQLMASDASLTQEEAMKRVASQTNDLMNWMQQLGIQSSLTMESVREAWRKLLISGMPSEMAMQVVEAMADMAAAFGMSAGTQAKFTKALGDMAAKTYLAGEEMRQLVNAGFGYAQVAQIMNMSEKEVVDAISAKTITMEKFFPRFITWAQQYEGSAEKMAGSLQFMPQTLKEISDLLLIEAFGKWDAETGELTGAFGALQPVLTAFLDALRDPETIEGVRAFGEVLTLLVTPLLEDVAENLPMVIDAIGELAPALLTLVGPRVEDGLQTLIASIEILAGVVEISAAMRDLVNLILGIDEEGVEGWSKAAEAFQFIYDWATPLDDVLQLVADALANIVEGLEKAIELYERWKGRKGETTGGGGGGEPTAQAGRQFWPGGLGLVGELGPELVALPRGSRVYSNRDSQRMLDQSRHVTFGPGSVVVQGMGARQVKRGLASALRAAGVTH